MRYLILFLILCLGSCTTMKRAGQWVCDRVETVEKGASKVGNFFGTPGVVITDAFNIVLSAGCQALDVVLGVPTDLAGDVGLGGGDEKPAAAPDPSVGK